MLKKFNFNKVSAVVLTISLLSFDMRVALAAVDAAAAVTPPPLDFNGNVGSAVRKADGSIDFLAGFGKDISGGNFDRLYNGLSGQIEIGQALDEPVLNALTLSLAANLYGITETGKKFCKPMGQDYPGSVVHWYFSSSDYLAAERLRDALMKERMQTIEQKRLALASNKDKDQIQLDSVKLQIETLNAMIDSLSGSSLFSLDKKAADVRATSRIAWREKLLVAVNDSAVKTQEEDTKLVQAAQACGAGSNQSVGAARAGCARMLKTGESCDDEGKNCSPIMENIPVPGSCEVAGLYIPVIHKGVFEDIVALYSLTKIPSAEINKRYSRLVDQMTSMIASMPVSNDPQYDWTTPLNSCLDASFGKYVRDYGMACTANHKDEDLRALGYDKLGSSNDPLIIAARETVGRIPDTVEYDIIKKEYSKHIAAGDSNEVALLKIKAQLLQTPLGQAYLHNTPLDAAAKTKYEEGLQKYAQDNSIIAKSCLAGSVCNTFPGPEVEEPDFGLATSATLSESTVSFLEAVGITGDELTPAAEYFHKSWATDDLTLGHSKQRITYFESVKPKIESFLTDDRKRLGMALLQRERLIQYHQDLVDMYGNKDSSGKKSEVTTALNAKSYSDRNGSTVKSAINLAGNQEPSGALNKPTQELKIPILTASNQRLEVVQTMTGNKLSATGQAALTGSGSMNSYSVSASDKLKKSNQLLTKLAGAKKNVIANSTFFDSAPAEKTSKVATVNSAITPALSASTMSKFQDKGIAEAVSSLPESSESSSKKSGIGDLSGGSYNSYMQNFGFGGSAPSPRPLMASLKSPSVSPVKAVKMSDGRRGLDRSSSSLGGEDQGKVQDAVWHLENSNIKGNYTTTEDDSLFDILTKAHIRNYKKVQSVP